jgi:Zn-dependent peptidase ImmA (M78 family)
MKQMLTLAMQEGILTIDFPLVYPLLGIYLCNQKTTPVIGLSTCIDSIAEKRCIMAEELGHHFTSVGTCINNKEFYHYSALAPVSKVEYKAMRWAANYLIPENDLLDVIGSGLYEPWELAEHFLVTEDFANFRLRLFGANKI